jgi:PAS domain S-box-containing protein
LAGNSIARARFYEPLLPERSQALALFAQQVAGHLTQLRNRHTIRAQFEALKESQKQLRLLGDNLPNGFVFQWETDHSGARRFLYASAGLERIHNLTPEEVVSDCSHWYNQILPEDRELFERKESEAIALNRPFSAEFRIRNKRDDIRCLFVSSAFTRHEKERIRWDGLALDITERKRLEARLQHSQKMESIGHLAGGVAHEFNNLLAAIIMYINLAQLNEPGVDCRPILAEVEELCKRAANLVKQLLAFSRQSVLRMQPIELDSVVAAESRMLGRLLGERIRLEWSTVPNLPLILADKGMMGQVLLNLSLNARDAMPNGGVLNISLAVVDVTSPQECELLDINPGQYVCLTVRDTGCGMDQRTQQRLFEPFFTTKPVGQGTGLGLATVRGIIQQHRGALSVNSMEGKGTSFHIYLPAITVERSSGLTSLVTPSSQVLATILLVEDEIAIRTATSRYLQRSGYRIIEAGNAREALTLWDQHASSIDLLMTDMVMPGEMSGLQLAELLVSKKPQLKVILASGYHSDILDAGNSSAVPLTFLVKPFMPEELCEALSKCLKGSSKH